MSSLRVWLRKKWAKAPGSTQLNSRNCWLEPSLTQHNKFLGFLDLYQTGCCTIANCTMHIPTLLLLLHTKNTGTQIRKNLLKIWPVPISV